MSLRFKPAGASGCPAYTDPQRSRAVCRVCRSRRPRGSRRRLQCLLATQNRIGLPETRAADARLATFLHDASRGIHEPRPGQRPLCCARNTAGGVEALWRPEWLQLAKWQDRQDEWCTQVKQTLEAEEPGDHFAILDRAKRVALTCARDILGVTGGRLRPSIPNHSNEARRLQARA